MDPHLLWAHQYQTAAWPLYYTRAQAPKLVVTDGLSGMIVSEVGDEAVHPHRI